MHGRRCAVTIRPRRLIDTFLTPRPSDLIPILSDTAYTSVSMNKPWRDCHGTGCLAVVFAVFRPVVRDGLALRAAVGGESWEASFTWPAGIVAALLLVYLVLALLKPEWFA